MNETLTVVVGFKELVNLIIFVLAVIGMTNIIVDPATIAAPVRSFIKRKGPKWLDKLVSCYQCCGFWVGLFFSIILISYNPFIVITCGAAGSFIATWGAIYLNYIEANSFVDIDNE